MNVASLSMMRKELFIFPLHNYFYVVLHNFLLYQSIKNTMIIVSWFQRYPTLAIWDKHWVKALTAAILEEKQCIEKIT